MPSTAIWNDDGAIYRTERFLFTCFEGEVTRLYTQTVLFRIDLFCFRERSGAGKNGSGQQMEGNHCREGFNSLPRDSSDVSRNGFDHRSLPARGSRVHALISGLDQPGEQIARQHRCRTRASIGQGGPGADSVFETTPEIEFPPQVATDSSEIAADLFALEGCALFKLFC
jgi:hypothetical protein